jgi:hypothetical protein
MSLNRTSFDVHAFCALPQVRRVYHALVVGLAVFLLTIAVLREPFRGYLAEVQIEGPLAEGLDLDAAVQWLKQADPHAAAIASPAGTAPKSRIRVTTVAPRAEEAIKNLDELAGRWLFQYLPERLQSRRRGLVAELRAEVQSAREREDAARARLDSLRQRQWTQLQRAAETAISKSAVEPLPVPTTSVIDREIAPIDERSQARDKLAALKLELSRLAASCTDEHPQVIALRSQIASLERQLGLSPALINPRNDGRQSRAASPTDQSRVTRHFVATAVYPALGSGDEDLAAALEAAAGELSRASRQREAAEQRTSDRMQELSSQAGAAQWSAAPARVITRLGGTPRSLTLMIGLVLSSAAGLVMYRTTRTIAGPQTIETTAELASALELPVVGNTSRARQSAATLRRRAVARRIVPVLVWLAEGVVVLAAAACLISMAVEPSLVRQVVSDPLGTMSEVIGRFAGT